MNADYSELSKLFFEMDILLLKMQKAYCKLPTDDLRMNPILFNLELAWAQGVHKIGEIHDRKLNPDSFPPVLTTDDVLFLLGLPNDGYYPRFKGLESPSRPRHLTKGEEL